MRLTKEIKEHIVNAARNTPALVAEREAIGAERKSISDRVHAHMYGRYSEWLALAPCDGQREWVKTSMAQSIRVRGYRVVLLFSAPRPIPFEIDLDYGCERLKDDALCDELIAHEQKDEAFRGRVKDAIANVKALLGTCATDTRLREAWPDGASVYEPVLALYAPRKDTTAIAVRTDTINEALGLPPEVKP